MVIERGLDAGEFCLRLQKIIRSAGSTKAFGVGDLVVLYSGPSGFVRGKITTSFTGNWARSQLQAKKFNGRRIDDTKIGKLLAKLDLETYFIDFYGKDLKAIEKAEMEVWGFASKEFMRAQFRTVATAVCGAEEGRVFRKYEIDSVVRNRRVKTANNIPMQLFKDFHSIGEYEVFRLFCLSELLQARRTAQKENTLEAWMDYQERRKFFILERQYEIKNASPIPDVIRDLIRLQKRQALLASAMPKIKRAISGPSKPAARAHKVKRSRSP